MSSRKKNKQCHLLHHNINDALGNTSIAIKSQDCNAKKNCSTVTKLSQVCTTVKKK